MVWIFAVSHWSIQQKFDLDRLIRLVLNFAVEKNNKPNYTQTLVIDKSEPVYLN